jgi:hypothetical protein
MSSSVRRRRTLERVVPLRGVEDRLERDARYALPDDDRLCLGIEPPTRHRAGALPPRSAFGLRGLGPAAPRACGPVPRRARVAGVVRLRGGVCRVGLGRRAYFWKDEEGYGRDGSGAGDVVGRAVALGTDRGAARAAGPKGRRPQAEPRGSAPFRRGPRGPRWSERHQPVAEAAHARAVMGAEVEGTIPWSFGASSVGLHCHAYLKKGEEGRRRDGSGAGDVVGSAVSLVADRSAARAAGPKRRRPQAEPRGSAPFAAGRGGQSGTSPSRKRRMRAR